MGSGGSTLSSADKSRVAQEIKTLYEKCSADGLDDDIIQDILTKEYQRLMKSISSSATQATSKPAPLVNQASTSRLGTRSGLSVKASSASSKDGKPKVSRRRSFDTSRLSGGGKKNLMGIDKDEAQAMINSQSEALLAVASKDADQPVDSWDSVTQQPFCSICVMAFKSQTFLDRHVKYSDLHMKNVAKKDGTEKKPEDALTPPVVSKTPSIDETKPLAADTSTKLAEPQIEGKHYKLLYTGSKLFWRTQRSIDVDVYLHIGPHVLEIITFDSAKHKEMSRIYLNYAIVEQNLEHLVNGDFDEKMKELRQDRFFTMDDEAAFRQTLLLQRVSTYVLQRLQLDATGGLGEVTYVQLYGDADVGSPLLPEVPDAVTPVSLVRRRKTSSEEIEATINSIKLDRANIGRHIELARTLTERGAQLTAAVSAERVAAAVQSAVQYMTSPKWYHAVSAPKQRFIRAARRVIRMNLVAKTTAYLRKKEKEKTPVPSLSMKGSLSRKYSTRAKEV